MTALTLYFAPDSCARVSLIALEEIGCAYTLEVVAFMRGQHKSAEYLMLNPAGKVPTLVVEGRPLSENVAILSWLADRFPEAGLLPAVDSWGKAGQISDLAFAASGLHPIVTRLRIPQFFCDLPDGPRRVFEMAEAAMHPTFALLETRLARQRWWYRDQWSVMDAYLNWVWFRVSGTNFDVRSYPNIARHDADCAARPTTQRALARSAEIARDLERQGLAVNFTGPSAVKR